jgi:tRNA/rRNA methyltransferase
MRRWLVVLISPQESGNVGSAARVLKNFGAGGLRLVAPRCIHDGNEARRFSSGAADVLRRAQVFDTLPQALADRELTIGLSGVAGKHHRLDCVGLLPTRLLEGRDAMRAGALVFGPEDTGMAGTDMECLQYLWSLPTNPAFPSLNLAQALAVALAAVAESERQLGLSDLGIGIAPSPATLNPLADSPDPGDRPANHQELHTLMVRFETLLRLTGWDGRRRLIGSLGKIRNLFTRATITQREANLFHGIVRNANDRIVGRHAPGKPTKNKRDDSEFL